MAIQVGKPAKKSNRNVKPKLLNVISHCSICKEPVTADKNDKASRHGFKRYKKRKSSKEYYEFSQEDDKACAGSGEEVIWKKVK